MVLLSNKERFSGDWKNADQIVELVEPGDVVEIDMGHVSHFVFNISRGWCVHVTSVADGSSDTTPKYVVKDATDLTQEAGTFPCRICDFEKVAQDKQLIPRSLKDALQVARVGLAQGPVRHPLSDIDPVDGFRNIAKEFCIHWKFTKSLDKRMSVPSWRIIVGILMVVIAAGVSALLLTLS